MSFSSIPIIDFQRLQDPRTKEETLAQLRDAIFIVGFLYLTNHGLEVGRCRCRKNTDIDVSSPSPRECMRNSRSYLHCHKMSRTNAT